MLDITELNLKKAAQILAEAKHVTAFTGAGISVESGIPSYRGQGGIWTKYNPQVLDINFFHQNPVESWKHIRMVFYDYFAKAEPNIAHEILAVWEASGKLKSIITQNIDNLHFLAGSKNVIEFHGNSQVLTCTKCSKKYSVKDVNLDNIPPKCSVCGGLLKPDFIFFGEGIPEDAVLKSDQESKSADVFLVIGTTGEVYPAAEIPKNAARNGAKIIEINPEESAFTKNFTTVHLKGQAGEMLERLSKILDWDLPTD